MENDVNFLATRSIFIDVPHNFYNTRGPLLEEADKGWVGDLDIPESKFRVFI